MGKFLHSPSLTQIVSQVWFSFSIQYFFVSYQLFHIYLLHINTIAATGFCFSPVFTVVCNSLISFPISFFILRSYCRYCSPVLLPLDNVLLFLFVLLCWRFINYYETPYTVSIINKYLCCFCCLFNASIYHTVHCVYLQHLRPFPGESHKRRFAEKWFRQKGKAADPISNIKSTKVIGKWNTGITGPPESPQVCDVDPFSAGVLWSLQSHVVVSQ